MLGRWWQRRARLRALRARAPLAIWREATADIAVLRRLGPRERARLRGLTALLLARKRVVGAGGLRPGAWMRLAIGAQACLPVLGLDLEYYRGWLEIIVYPRGFRVERERHEESGLVTREVRALSGESWLHGPVVLAWDEVLRDMRGEVPGRNVVVHEFAHKLDMLNGRANGMPPLHREMSREQWTEVLTAAYAALRARLAGGEAPGIDPYAATGPAEFFAVCSECFFTEPGALLRFFPRVYEQLARFYRQRPRPL